MKKNKILFKVNLLALLWAGTGGVVHAMDGASMGENFLLLVNPRTTNALLTTMEFNNLLTNNVDTKNKTNISIEN